MSITMESFSYLALPALRFIGRDVVAGEPAPDQYGQMWGRSGEFLPRLDGCRGSPRWTCPAR